VTVLCPYPTRPLGADYPAFDPRRNHNLVTQGDSITIVRLPSFTYPESTPGGRMRESLSFGKHVIQHLNTQRPVPDTVYANTWPLFSQALIARYCAKRRIPLVLHIQDVYPEALAGKAPRWMTNLANPRCYWLDRWVARKSNKLILISRRIRNYFQETRHVPDAKLATIANWQDEALFNDPPCREAAYGRYSVPKGGFIFVFCGSVVPSAGVDLLIRAFRSAGIRDTKLVIAGGGSDLSECIRFARSSPDIRFCAVS